MIAAFARARHRAAALAALLAGALLAAPAARAQDSEESALKLADLTPQAVEQARDLRAFLEGAYGGDLLRGTGQTQQDKRLSADLLFDHTLAPHWRVMAADRVDFVWPAQVPGMYNIEVPAQFAARAPPQYDLEAPPQRAIQTLKDAYLSWQPQEGAILDLGRINVREGVAQGYNPTDFFRAGAVRSVISVDPLSLKENRQGSVMLRGQTLWEGGSVTALFSPKLAEAPNAGGWNLDVGGTNAQDRWLLTASQRIFEGFSPQLLAYREPSRPVQIGANLTGLLNDATVAYLEWSGGRSLLQLSEALAQGGLPHPDDEGFRSRAAAGSTYTTSYKLSVTLELQYDGAALDRAAWDQLYAAAPLEYGLYRLWLLGEREMPAQRAVFLYSKWQDALVNRLDLALMENLDAVDHSRLTWLEVRYRFERAETALQWQRYSGGATTDYGAAPQAVIWEILLRWYL